MFNFGRKKDKRKKEDQKFGAPLISFTQPKSVNAEQYRTLRTNLEFAQVGKPIRSIAVSSSVPMEGKSTLSSNLAYTYSQTKRNVLIVDADLRKPTLHRTFHIANERGLTTLLANPSIEFNQVVQRSPELGLYFLPSGPIPPNPAELIGSPQMQALMKTLAENFDMVIYDTPPINSVTDAQILATKVDGVLVVARQGLVKKDELRQTKQSLDNVNANLLGVVLSGVELESGSEYYAYYGLTEGE